MHTPRRRCGPRRACPESNDMLPFEIRYRPGIAKPDTSQRIAVVQVGEDFMSRSPGTYVTKPTSRARSHPMAAQLGHAYSRLKAVRRSSVISQSSSLLWPSCSGHTAIGRWSSRAAPGIRRPESATDCGRIRSDRGVSAPIDDQPLQPWTRPVSVAGQVPPAGRAAGVYSLLSIPC